MKNTYQIRKNTDKKLIGNLKLIIVKLKKVGGLYETKKIISSQDFDKLSILISSFENIILEIKALRFKNNTFFNAGGRIIELQTENINYSSQIIELNQIIEDYRILQQFALEQANVSRLSIQDLRGLDIEYLRNKLTKSHQNTEILWREIDLRKFENSRLIKQIKECSEYI